MAQIFTQLVDGRPVKFVFIQVEYEGESYILGTRTDVLETMDVERELLSKSKFVQSYLIERTPNR